MKTFRTFISVRNEKQRLCICIEEIQALEDYGEMGTTIYFGSLYVTVKESYEEVKKLLVQST